jgi:hypothetical protein
MTRARRVLVGLTMLVAACTGDPMLEPDAGPPEALVPAAPGVLAAPAAPVPAALTLPACTHHWASAVSGTWFTAARWSPATVPGAGSTACIDAAGTYTVTLDPASDATPVNLDGIAVGGGASGTQTLALAGTAAIVNLTAGMDIKSNGVFTVRGASGMVITAGAVANAGRLATLATCGGCGEATIRADLDNAGTLVVSGNGLRLDKVNGVYSNSGTIDIAGSLLIPASAGSPSFTQQAGSITSSGVNTNSAIFQMQGGTYTYNGGNTIVTARGLVVLEGVNLVFGPSPIGTATFSTMPSAAGNTFTGNIGATQTVRFRRTGGGTEIPTRTLTLVGDVRNDGVLEISPGVSLPILAGTGTLTNKGTFRVVGNVDSARVAINLLNEGTVDFTGAFLLLDQPGLSYINAGEIKGPITWPMIVDGATLINQANGKLTKSTDLINGAHLRGTGTNTARLRVMSGSTVDPGFSPGTLTLGSLDIVSGGVLNIELGGETAGTGYDQIQVAGQSTVSGGTLNVTTVAGFEAGKCGQVFDIIPNHSPGGVGQFATTNGLDLGNGRSLKVLYSQTVIRLVGLDAGKLVGIRTDPVALTEAGPSAQYYVCLGQRPNATVTITPSPDAQVTVSPASITFTSSDWELPKAFTITAVDDQAPEGAHTGRVSHVAASSDTRFSGFAIGQTVANITDNDVNSPPVAGTDAVETVEDTPVTIDILTNDTDPDGDTFSVTSAGGASHGTTQIVNGGTAVRYTPEANYNGPDGFSYTLTDSRGGTGTGSVSVAVTPAPDAAVAGDDNATTRGRRPVVVSVLANDLNPDGGALSVLEVTRPAHGVATITGAGQTVTYRAAANYLGPDQFSYTTGDGSGPGATATVFVTVLDPNANTAPTAVDDGARINGAGSKVRIPVLDNDSDPEGDKLALVSVSGPARGIAQITGRTIVYEMNGATVQTAGSDQFTYTIRDPLGATASATVTVTWDGRYDQRIVELVQDLTPVPPNASSPVELYVTAAPFWVSFPSSQSATVEVSLPPGAYNVGKPEGPVSGARVPHGNCSVVLAGGSPSKYRCAVDSQHPPYIVFVFNLPLSSTTWTTTATIAGSVADPKPANNSLSIQIPSNCVTKTDARGHLSCRVRQSR